MTVLIEYTMRYYRNAQWARRFAQAGIIKPEGMVTSPHRSQCRDVVETAVQHVNAEMPEKDCELIVFKNGRLL